MIKRLVILFYLLFTCIYPVHRAHAFAAVVSDPGNTATNATTLGQVIWDVVSKEVLLPAVQTAAFEVIDDMAAEAVNWATGGFDGEPSFINDFGDFLKGTEHEVLSSVLSEATDVAQDYGIDSLVGSDARANYEAWASGELTTARAITGIIAGYGANELNYDPINAILSGERNTLENVVGSNQAANDFKDDITQGGILGLIALTTPENTDIGLQSAVIQATRAKSREEVEQVTQDLNLPTRFLGKTECLEEDSAGNCIREKTTTPGEIVNARLTESLNKDTVKAASANSLISSLVQSLGNLAGDLVDRGLSELTSQAVGLFYGDADLNSAISSVTSSIDYQSSFDVLGVTGSTSNLINTGLIQNQLDTTTGTSGTPAGFIGGPEDTENGWENSPTIIINFQEDLEKNQSYLEEETGYYDAITNTLISVKEIAISLDRCLPGPDFDWESRYSDVFSSTDNTANREGADVREVNSSSLTKMRRMVNDPMVNIPGSEMMRNTFSSLVEENRRQRIQTEQRIISSNSTLRNINGIVAEVSSQFDSYMQNLEIDNLVLFESEWNGMEDVEKIAAGSIAATGIETSAGTISPYLQTQEGETITSVLENDPDRVKNAVISMAWDIWRDNTDTETKTLLRSNYYSLQNDLSSPALIARAQSNAQNMESQATLSSQLLIDCLVLKAYVFGADPEIIAVTINQTDTTNLVSTLAAQRNLLELSPSIVLDEGARTQVRTGRVTGFTFNSYSGRVNYIEPTSDQIVIDITDIEGGEEFYNTDEEIITSTRNVRTNDQEIKEFLQNEYEKQTDDDPNTTSIFLTEHFTSEQAITNSILGFDPEITETVPVQISLGTANTIPEYEERELSEKLVYFNTYYPDIEMPPSTIGQQNAKNATTVFQIFQRDRVYVNYQWIDDVRSTLFCRNPQFMDVSRYPRVSDTVCLRDFAVALNIHYDEFFPG